MAETTTTTTTATESDRPGDIYALYARGDEGINLPLPRGGYFNLRPGGRYLLTGKPSTEPDAIDKELGLRMIEEGIMKLEGGKKSTHSADTQVEKPPTKKDEAKP